MEKNYEDINTTVSFSVLHCFCSVSYSFHIIVHERVYLLSINTKEGGTQNKTHIPSCVFLLCTFLVILFGGFILTISDYFWNHCFLQLFLLLSITLCKLLM